MRDWQEVGESQSSDDAVLWVCCTCCMQELGVCCTQSILYLVSNSSSWCGVIERNNSTWFSEVMVELRTRMREMRGGGGNGDEKLRHKTISCVGQFTIPKREGKTPNLVSMNTIMRSSKHIQASLTCNLSYPLLSSKEFPFASPFCLSWPQLYHHHRTQS